jgi:DNA-nicking Smr family endonuclease
MTRKLDTDSKHKRRIHAQPHDLDLWHRAMADVKPLTGRQNNDTPETLTGKSEKTAQIRRRQTMEIAPIHHAQPNDLLHGQAPGLDKRTQQRLRRGQVDIEARLDLHGMTQTAAHQALERFLERAHMAGKKTVLVVTGKGLRADGEIGVLRRAVPRWLNEAPMRQWVHAFDHAAPRDGGEGALYIVMRRRK